MALQSLPDGQWISGCDSMNYNLGQGFYQWGQNVVNRGGILETRQGFAELASIAQSIPRGCAMVTIGNDSWLLAAIDDKIYKLNLGLATDELHIIPGLSFPSTRRQVHFEVCVQAQETQPNGNTRFLPTPKFVVVIQDGTAEPQYWDGTNAGRIRDLYPTPINQWTKKGTFMKWVGDRLWVANGKQMYASDLLNPFQFTEQEVTASGGFFYLPDAATGMGITHDYKSLLVFTNFTASAFQVGLEDRTTWPTTQDFQRVILPNIGCAAHRTIINQYGMTWWMSHDGIVGLDNALTSYQSSKLDIQDQNMIRSKAGINWGQGGGCSGTYANFLLFSVPSGSKWNNHTWAMDEAVINTIQGMAPPAWCSNWTGIRPEQWVTGQVRGQQRCFCISRDLTNTGHQSTIWEAFIGQRMDVPKVDGVRRAKDIGCAVETRFMGLSPAQYCDLRWVELDVAEINGNVDLHTYYCGRRTSYKQIINTHLTSSVNVGTEEVFEDGTVRIFVPQFRTIRSYTDVHSEDDNDSGIQTPYLRYRDREFSVLVQWSGQMALCGLRMAVDPRADYQEGTEFPDEYLQRGVTAEGEGQIGVKLPPANAPTGEVQSSFLAPQKPRWVEFPSYDSAVPNGVFFVTELVANPPPGAYPHNHFPITVDLVSSETQGVDIYYTRDGTNPHGPPNQHGTHYTATSKPSISLNQELRARGERDGMSPSPLLHGRYVQIACEDPVFNPEAGSSPPDAFPITVRLSTPTAGAEIRYVINNGVQPCVTPASTRYDPTSPPQVDANKYLHAKAFKAQYLNSDETIGRYLAIPRCVTPTCAPDGGAYPAADYAGAGKAIAMGSTTQGSRLRYTINNTDMTQGTAATNPFTVHVHVDDVLRVIAQKSDHADSLVKTATYSAEREQCESPTLTPQDGIAYDNNHTMNVVFTSPTSGSTVSYTLQDQGQPDNHPTHDNGNHITTFPTTITFQVGQKIIRAIAFRADLDDSDEVVGTYEHDHSG